MYGYVLELDVSLGGVWEPCEELEGDLEIVDKGGFTGWESWDGNVSCEMLESGRETMDFIRHRPSGESVRYERFLFGVCDEAFYVGVTGQLQKRLYTHLMNKNAWEGPFYSDEVSAVREVRTRAQDNWEEGVLETVPESESLSPPLDELQTILLEFATGRSSATADTLSEINYHNLSHHFLPETDVEDMLAREYLQPVDTEETHFTELDRIVYNS